MSLLEQLVRQLGEIEIDPDGLVLIVDGREVEVNESITVRVARRQTASRPVVEPPAESAPPTEAAATEDDQDEADEWEWKLAIARARAREDEPREPVRPLTRAARGTAPLAPSTEDDVTKKTFAAPPRPVMSASKSRARIASRPRAIPRHVPRKPAPSRSGSHPIPPPLPPPPED